MLGNGALDDHDTINQLSLSESLDQTQTQVMIPAVVLGKPDSPYLACLAKLPPTVKVVGIGQSLADLTKLGLRDKDFAEVQVLFNTGTADPGCQSQRETIKELWPKLTSLRWMHTASAGVEHILFPELVSASNVVLTNNKGLSSSSLAEFCMMACTYFAKQVPQLRKQQREHNWKAIPMTELSGKTMGVVGHGSIGQAVARLGRAFGMHILALQRQPQTASQAKEGTKVLRPDQLIQLMAESDYVILALPGTLATRGLVSAEAIAAMKPTGVIVNVGRGSTVDEPALIEALTARRIKGAALDVVSQEPLSADSALWDLDNVLLSPHTADNTDEWHHACVQLFVDLAKQYAAGKGLPNQVDKAAGY